MFANLLMLFLGHHCRCCLSLKFGVLIELTFKFASRVVGLRQLLLEP
jgi:hypothetical protein